MTFRKVLSVFLAVLMFVSVMSAGLVGLAADIDYNTQYSALADALKNDYVRDLTNYTITNKTLENDTSGFDTDANGFAYEHRVTAKDNAHSDILRAANIFYYIAEHIITTTPEVGISNAGLLVDEVTGKLKKYFNDDDEDYYEDFYGERYYPTEEEVAKYNEVVTNLALVDREVTQASLTSFNIYFMKKDYYEYYNVDTIIKYFAGNALKINAGNWYHKYLFVVETSVDTWLQDSKGINNLPDTFPIRTSVFEWQYERSFNDTQTKAFYAFKQPALEDVCAYFGVSPSSVDDLRDEDDITANGQASAFYISSEEDTTTVPLLYQKYSLFTPYIQTPVDANGKAWDARFAKMNESQLASEIPNSAEIVSAFEWLTANFSNDALVKLFGKDLGNMVTLAYILKPISQSPERTVRGSAKYIATADKLNDIVHDMDALVYDTTSDTSKRVGTIVKQFFNTDNELFAGTAVAGMDFSDPNELVHHLVTGLLFRDSIVNMLIELIYPMIVDLIQEEVIDKVADAVGSGLGDIVNDLLTNIITQNDLAIYPDDLAARINKDYPGVFPKATAVLAAGGHSWTNFNFDALDWGVDGADYDKKAELFIDALCAGLGGFMRAVVTVMCGDAEYSENAGLSYDKDQFDTYYDKKLINILGITGWLRSQGGYSKLIVPLFRVLGIPEMASGAKYNTPITGYVTPADYHKIIASKDGNGNYRYSYSLRLILAPIIYWVENILAQRPFETIWALIPNLVYFFTRQGNSVVPLSTIKSHNTQDERDADTAHGNVFNSTNGKNEWEELGNYNLITILDTVNLIIDITVPILFNKNFKIDIGSLASLIDKNEMLSSINGLLAELLGMEYVVGESGNLNTVAYANAEGIAVMPDSYEYGINPSAYPIALDYVYANEDETEYRAAPDDTHSKEITNPEMLKKPYAIPQLQEAKLTSVTTLKADGTLNDPNAIGILKSEWNTIDVRNPGVVLMYVLRFVLSALGYRYDISDGADEQLPILIECFGLDIDNELFQGLNLKDIIYNVMLHPDEAICVLLELFYSNEDGNLYEGVSYTYPLQNIDYHEDVLLSPVINPSLLYGTPVKYTKYWTREYARDTIANAEELVKNVLMMLGTEGFEDGIGPYLKNMLDGLAFNNDLINTLFNTIYQLLGGLNDQVGFDIEAILDAALGVTFKPQQIGATLEKMLGYSTQASETIKAASSWSALFTAGYETDPVSGEESPIISDVNFDWGIADAEEHGLTTHTAFLKVASALLSPAAFVFRFLFLDQHLDILGLIELNGYAGYQYAFIGLLEMLSCPDILTYKEYYRKSDVSNNNKATGEMMGDANTIYYLLSPILSLLDKVYADPISTVLELIPNLLFFISIGGLNDLLNNLVHFAYVLLDILKPIVNGYDLLNGLISNINISGFILNLSLPLDLDFNALISDLLGSLVGDALTIEGVKITLPYIDFHTLCCGILDDDFTSKEERHTVRLDSAGGGDLLTALLRLVFEALFMEENKEALGEIIVNAVGSSEAVDDYDRKTAKDLIDTLFDLMEEYEVPDILLFAVYFIADKATPVSGTLAGALKASGMTITELFSDISDPAAFIKTVIGLFTGEQEDYHDGEPDDDDSYVRDGKAAMSIWERIKAFFQKIGDFFRKLFGKA